MIRVARRPILAHGMARGVGAIEPIVALVAQGAQPPEPEGGEVASVRLDVVGDRCGLDTACLQAQSTQRLDAQLVAPAVDLVRAGKLDEAERAARDLLDRFPEVHDGWDRLGMVFEARGENRAAADCYRKVIAFIRQHPDDYDAEFADKFVELVNKLNPQSPA